MMFRLLTDRLSPLVIALELLSVYTAYRAMKTHYLAIVFTILYGMLLLYRHIPWYKRAHRGHGIEDHFAKVFVIGMYLYLLLGWLFLGTGFRLALMVGIAVVGALVAINTVLLYYHFQDRSPMPPAYLQRDIDHV